MDEAIRAGLVAYASGDVESALKAWSGVDPARPEFEYVREYLGFVRDEDPEAFSGALGDYEIPGALAPRGQPLPPPMHVPALPRVEAPVSAPEPKPVPASPTVSGESSFTPPIAHAPPRAPKAAPTPSAPPPAPSDRGRVVAEGLLPPLDELSDLPLEEPDGMAISGSSGWDPTASLVEAATAKEAADAPPIALGGATESDAALPSAPIPLGDSSDAHEPAGSPSSLAPTPIALDGTMNEPESPAAPIAPGGSTDAHEAPTAQPAIPLSGSEPDVARRPAMELDDFDSGIHTEVEFPEELGAGFGAGAFDLVQQVDDASASEEPRGESLEALEQKLNELSELDDLSGALEVAKQILAMDPEHRVARAAEGRSRDVLMKMASSKIGDLAAVPTVLCPPDQVIWLDLDHRSGFILSQVDGVSSYQDIMEIAGMDHLECALILAELVSGGVIGRAA